MDPRWVGTRLACGEVWPCTRKCYQDPPNLSRLYLFALDTVNFVRDTSLSTTKLFLKEAHYDFYGHCTAGHSFGWARCSCSLPAVDKLNVIRKVATCCYDGLQVTARVWRVKTTEHVYNYRWSAGRAAAPLQRKYNVHARAMTSWLFLAAAPPHGRRLLCQLTEK